MPGPPKTPSKLKVLKGTYQKSRENPDEPIPSPVGEMKPPVRLSKKAKYAFYQLVDVLGQEGLNILADADRLALELLCESYGTYRDAKQVVENEGMTYHTYTMTGDKMYRTRPEVAIANEAWNQVTKMIKEFGLTPAARAKVKTKEVEEQDPLSKIMEQFG